MSEAETIPETAGDNTADTYALTQSEKAFSRLQALLADETCLHQSVAMLIDGLSTQLGRLADQVQHRGQAVTAEQLNELADALQSQKDLLIKAVRQGTDAMPPVDANGDVEITTDGAEANSSIGGGTGNDELGNEASSSSADASSAASAPAAAGTSETEQAAPGDPAATNEAQPEQPAEAEQTPPPAEQVSVAEGSQTE